MQTSNIRRQGVVNCQLCHEGIMHLEGTHQSDTRITSAYHIRAWATMIFYCDVCSAKMELSFTEEGSYIKEFTLPQE